MFTQTISSQESTFKYTGSLEFIFNNEDFVTGGAFGAYHEEKDFRILATALFRPVRKKVFVRQSSNFLIRYLERRFFFGPVLEKHISFSGDVYSGSDSILAIDEDKVSIDYWTCSDSLLNESECWEVKKGVMDLTL